MTSTIKHFPIFTIVTISLNNFSGLQKTYASLEKQSFEDYEWLVIDGGSKDETIDFLRAQRSNTRTALNPFRFISEFDSGIYDAMNKGIQEARGHYILFLNAGDELASNDILETIHPYTEQKPEFIYGDALEPNKRGKLYTKTARQYRDLIWGMITHHQAMLYRRHTIRDFKIRYSLLYKIASDYDFTVRFLLKAKKILYIPKPICIFEQGGISQQKAWLGRKEQYLIREKTEMVPQYKNLWILLIQTFSSSLKSFSPGLYRMVKPLFIRKSAAQKKTPN